MAGPGHHVPSFPFEEATIAELQAAMTSVGPCTASPQAEATAGLDDPAYTEALATSKRLATKGIDQTLARFDLDAIVSLTNSPPWVREFLARGTGTTRAGLPPPGTGAGPAASRPGASRRWPGS